ncbi:hypothetical protein TNCV_2366771 [Trichonephila clavipes]|nr:hypothetical protein TNCV_2366771 [Trichonephila clavipes]
MLPKEPYQKNYEAINVALRLVKKTQGRKSSKCLFVDHQMTAKREQNLTVLLENNVSVLAKSVCDLCPLLKTRKFGTFSLVLLENHQRKIKKSLKVDLKFGGKLHNFMRPKENIKTVLFTISEICRAYIHLEEKCQKNNPAFVLGNVRIGGEGAVISIDGRTNLNIIRIDTLTGFRCRDERDLL